MRTIKKYASTLPVVALCVLILGSAVAFSQKRFMTLTTGRPLPEKLSDGTRSLSFLEIFSPVGTNLANVGAEGCGETPALGRKAAFGLALQRI